MVSMEINMLLVIKSLNKCSVVIFQFLMSKKGFGSNLVPVTHKEISEGTGYGKNTVERSMYQLRKNKMVIQKGYGKVMVNPSMVYSGPESLKSTLEAEYKEEEGRATFESVKRSVMHHGYKGRMFSEAEYRSGLSMFGSKKLEEKVVDE